MQSLLDRMSQVLIATRALIYHAGDQVLAIGAGDSSLESAQALIASLLRNDASTILLVSLVIVLLNNRLVDVAAVVAANDLRTRHVRRKWNNCCTRESIF